MTHRKQDCPDWEMGCYNRGGQSHVSVWRAFAIMSCVNHSRNNRGRYVLWINPFMHVLSVPSVCTLLSPWYCQKSTYMYTGPPRSVLLGLGNTRGTFLLAISKVANNRYFPKLCIDSRPSSPCYLLPCKNHPLLSNLSRGSKKPNLYGGLF